VTAAAGRSAGLSVCDASDDGSRDRRLEQMDPYPDSRPDHAALALVMEGRVALDDAVRLLMVRQKLDRASATDAVVRAAAFASDEYGGRALDRQVAHTL
jgi:hypothetical protein